MLAPVTMVPPGASTAIRNDRRIRLANVQASLLSADFARTSLIERSKICLSLNKRENWPIPSVGRVSYLINNGALVVWEEPSYETGHEPYSLAVAIDAIVETCAAVIGDYDPGLGERNALAYQRDLPMSKILRRAVAETCGHLE